MTTDSNIPTHADLAWQTQQYRNSERLRALAAPASVRELRETTGEILREIRELRAEVATIRELLPKEKPC